MKRPSFQFYPGDWLRDTALRSVSVGARGAWIDMLCLMHEGSPYGHLKVGAKVILPDNLARILGATSQETEGWLKELEEAGVFSRADDGCIFSRRMIRDEEIRAKRAAGGVLGGNPKLKHPDKDGLKVGAKVNLKVAGKDNSNPTPSSSSSSSDNLLPLGAALATDSPAKGQRKRDPLFDALVEIEGGNPSEVTGNGGGAIGKALSQIKGVCPALTVEEIRRRAANYRRVMPPGTMLSATALAKHWGRCGEQPAAQRKSIEEQMLER